MQTGNMWKDQRIFRNMTKIYLEYLHDLTIEETRKNLQAVGASPFFRSAW